MSTASTKLNKQKANKVKAPAADAQVSATQAEVVMSDGAWFIAVVAILLVAAILRLYDLNLVIVMPKRRNNGDGHRWKLQCEMPSRRY